MGKEMYRRCRKIRFSTYLSVSQGII